MKGDKGISGKTIGKGGIKLGKVVAANRPVLVSAADGAFLCSDGAGGVVVKTSAGTSDVLKQAAVFSALGTTTGFLSATGDAVLAGSTFTGNTGTLAYTIGDIVKALKTIGVLKS